MLWTDISGCTAYEAPKDYNTCSKMFTKRFKGKHYFGDPDVDGRMILNFVQKCKDVNWIKLAQDMVR